MSRLGYGTKLGRFTVMAFVILLVGMPVLSASATTITKSEWEQLALQTNPANEGCSSISYPSTTWSAAACGTPSSTLTVVGNGVDKVAGASNAIGETEGLFSGITGLTSETDNTSGSDLYSLQVNTNHWSTTTSYTSGTVTAWQQFVFQNFGSGTNEGSLFMEYVLIDYYTVHGSCPSSSPTGVTSWTPYTVGSETSCYAASSSPTTTSTELPTHLGSVLLEGITGQNGNDISKMCDFSTDTCWTNTVTDFMNLASSNWTYSEFNVFGIAGGSRAEFNTGTYMYVEVHLWDLNGNSDTATCNGGGYTGESNNLTLNSGSCSAGSGYMDFGQSN